jgi:hypothetical protein
VKSTFTFSIKTLKIISISYLALPIILFLIFWVKPIFSIPLLSTFIYSFIIFFKSEDKTPKTTISYFNFICFLAIIAIWLLLSGSGGMGFQSPDITKHNSIFKDIIASPFPTSYIFEGKKMYLSAYIGYHITIPVLFSWLPWPIMMHLVTLWTYLGVIIGLCWFGILVGSFSPKWFVFFIFIGGIDIAAFVYSAGFEATINLIKSDFYEKIPFFATNIDPNLKLYYQSNTYTLFWGSQHAIPAWIGTGMFFYDWEKQKDITKSPLYLILIPFWSPFILIGLTPFILYQLLVDGLKKYLTIQNLILIPLFIILVWFVNSVPVSDLDKGFLFYKPARLLGYLNEIKLYLIFLFLEVIIWAIPLYYFWKKEALANFKTKENKLLLIFIVVILCLIPLYKLGKWNDFVQRVSLPALFMLWIFAGRVWQLSRSIFVKLSFTILLIMGSWDSLYHILFSLKVTENRIKYTALPFEKVTTVIETSKRENWPIEQVLAPDSATFFKYISK